MVLAPRPGGACCFRFFTRSPGSHYRCNTRANTDSTARSINKRAVRDIFWLLSRESGYATQPNPMCHRPSNLTDEIYLLRVYSSAHKLSRLRSRNQERHDVWQHMHFRIMHASTYILLILLYRLLFLLVAVQPINVLTGSATQDCLLHLCMNCCSMQLTVEHDVPSCGECVYCLYCCWVWLLFIMFPCCIISYVQASGRYTNVQALLQQE